MLRRQRVPVDDNGQVLRGRERSDRTGLSVWSLRARKKLFAMLILFEHSTPAIDASEHRKATLWEPLRCSRHGPETGRDVSRSPPRIVFRTAATAGRKCVSRTDLHSQVRLVANQQVRFTVMQYSHRVPGRRVPSLITTLRARRAQAGGAKKKAVCETYTDRPAGRICKHGVSTVHVMGFLVLGAGRCRRCFMPTCRDLSCESGRRERSALVEQRQRAFPLAGVW